MAGGRVNVEIGAPEITGGGAVGLGTILVWQLIRLIGKVQAYLEETVTHRKSMEAKFDVLIAGVKAMAAPRRLEPSAPVQHLHPEARQ